jgi:hypothetical protein
MSRKLMARTIDPMAGDAQGGAMRRLVGFVLAGAVLAPGLALAQVQPHRAEYALRLGMTPNAPRIGTAIHDLSLDCTGWHLKRDIKTEIALTANAANFPALMFDAEVMGDAFLIEVTEQPRDQLRAGRSVDKPATAPTGKSWPVFMTFTRGRQQDTRPLFSVGALVFDNGVLDRLTIETGLVTVTADLQSLEMRPVPNCPRS